MGQLKRCGSGLPAWTRPVLGPHCPGAALSGGRTVRGPHCPVLTVRINGPTALTSEQEPALHEAIPWTSWSPRPGLVKGLPYGCLRACGILRGRDECRASGVRAETAAIRGRTHARAHSGSLSARRGACKAARMRSDHESPPGNWGDFECLSDGPSLHSPLRRRIWPPLW